MRPFSLHLNLKYKPALHNISMDKQYELDKRYIRMASIWSENSYCQRRKVGALIVKDKMIISDGYNGTPSGFENICEDENNVTKPYVLHAEANAITKIARSNNSSDGATMYVTASPCIECAKLIIQAGIKRVVYSTYQAVSGAGVAGWKDLENGMKGEAPKKFPHPIASNCLPHIDSFLDNGYTKEEIVQNYAAMIETVQANNPDCQFVILSTLPTTSAFYSGQQGKITLLNMAFKRFANKTPNVTFVDAYSAFCPKAGEYAYAELLSDGLHPNAEGCAKIAEMLTPYLLPETDFAIE